MADNIRDDASNASHLSKASDTYHEVKDLLKGLLHSSSAGGEGNQHQRDYSNATAPAGIPYEQRRVNNYHNKDASVNSLNSFGRIDNGSRSPDKRNFSRRLNSDLEEGALSRGSPTRPNDFDKLLAAQALA